MTELAVEGTQTRGGLSWAIHVRVDFCASHRVWVPIVENKVGPRSCCDASRLHCINDPVEHRMTCFIGNILHRKERMPTRTTRPRDVIVIAIAIETDYITHHNFV